MSTPIRNSPSGKLKQIPPAVSVNWRPDGQGDVTTWEEVMAIVGENKCPVSIYTPQQTTYVIDPGPSDPAVVWDMHGSVITAPRGPHDNLRVQIRRNATLKNLASIIGGVRLQASKQAGDPPALTFEASTPGQTCVFVVDQGAELHNLSNAQEPMILVPPSTVMPEFYLAFNELGTAQADGGGVAVVKAGPGSIVKIVVLSGGLSLDTIQPAGWFDSDATALVGWMHDGSMAFPSNFWTPVYQGAGTSFNMALGQCGGMGPNAFRPVDQNTGGNISIGCMYFATDQPGGLGQGIPIWWSAGGWVDATGAGPL